MLVLYLPSRSPELSSNCSTAPDNPLHKPFGTPQTAGSGALAAMPGVDLDR